jgi:glutathione S-transferase
VLKFHNYPYEFRQVNIRAGEQKTPEYLKLQPVRP